MGVFCGPVLCFLSSLCLLWPFLCNASELQAAWAGSPQGGQACVRACELLPQLAKVRQDSTGTEVVRNHADTRSQAGLNVRPNNKPRLHGLLSQQTCQSQHRWGTTNDRKEANHGCVCVQRVPAVSMADGLQLLVQLMTAAMTTEPCASWYSWPQCRKGILMFCLSLEMWNPLNPTWG